MGGRSIGWGDGAGGWGDGVLAKEREDPVGETGLRPPRAFGCNCRSEAVDERASSSDGRFAPTDGLGNGGTSLLGGLRGA